MDDPEESTRKYWWSVPKLLSDPEQKDHLDAALADAMNKLSVKERENVFHELHGVKDAILETPEFIAEKMDELEAEIVNIKESKTIPSAAIELAEALSPAYVQDPKLRLPFLRTEEFDAKMAAERFVCFFELKFSLFGGGKLCKDIVYEDLEPHDIESFEMGFIQILPVRDRAGRTIIVVFPSQQHFDTNYDVGASWGRITFYLRGIVEDDHMEQKGLVAIIYNVGEVISERFYPEIPAAFFKSRKCMPTKYVSLHFCFSNPAFRLILQHILPFLGIQGASVKCHHGSQQEVMYSLMTYGIPTDLLPVSFDNKLKRNNHLEMIKTLRIKEERIRQYGKTELIVVLPYVYDVLYGKGGPSQDRPGNMKLKMTVDELLPMYNEMEKNEKYELAKHVVETVKEKGGRFLSKDTGVWMVVPDDAARQKVATLFRNRRKASQRAAAKGRVIVPKAPRSNSFIKMDDRHGPGDSKRSRA